MRAVSPAHPEEYSDALKHGYTSRPQGNASPGDIALGNKTDPGIKPASSSMFGARNPQTGQPLPGKQVAIDTGSVKQSGGSITTQPQIKEDISNKVASGAVASQRQTSYNSAQASEHEVLVNGPTGPVNSAVAARAATGIGSLGAGIGLGFTMRAMVDASKESLQTQSMAPVLHAAAQQTSIFGGAMVGARVGAPFGVEGGPLGMMVTGAIGAVIGGLLGSAVPQGIRYLKSLPAPPGGVNYPNPL